MTLTEDIPFLPKNKTAIDVFADYFRYLYRCTLTYISETYGGGAALLSTMEEHTEFIITHPNGWEGLPQSHLRKAAARGGLVPDPDDDRIHFVTEGEAALHFCMRNHLTGEVMKVNIKYLLLRVFADFFAAIAITERWRHNDCRCWGRDCGLECLRSQHRIWKIIIRGNHKPTMYAPHHCYR